MSRILVAMSGGVDSSVAALLLKQQGHDIVGAYMKNWINEDNVIGHCPWMQDIEDARATAEAIGIEFRVVNLMQDYRRLVVDYLLDGYQHGLTPNPDVMCNREMKFGVFARYARTEGFSAVATGHYARRVEANKFGGSGITPRRGDPTPAESGHKAPPTSAEAPLSAEMEAGPSAPQGSDFTNLSRGTDLASKSLAQDDGPVSSEGTAGSRYHPSSFAKAREDEKLALAPAQCAGSQYQLFEGLDKNKDQSYFLALLSQSQLRDALFPIGHLTKPELRVLADEAKLPTAGKKDSQGICFIGEVKMADFLRTYVPDHPGPIVRATDGKILGQHRGLHYYTIGQRRGIRIPSNTDNQAYVVVGKRADDHALLVAFDQPDAPGLWVGECRVHSLSFIGEPITSPQRLECRVRYRDPRVAIDFTPVGRVVPDEPSSPARQSLGDGGANISFSEPQRAIAPGQIMALYRGEQLLGGAVFV